MEGMSVKNDRYRATLMSNVSQIPNSGIPGKRGGGLWSTDVGVLLIELLLLGYLVSIFFADFLPDSGTLRQITLVAAIITILARIARRRTVIKLRSPLIAWLIFIGYCLMNRGTELVSGSGQSWLVYFSLTLVLSALLVSDTPEWLSWFMRVIAFFGLVHACATFVFFLFPSLYPLYRELFLGGKTVIEAGYKSGLTTHYSTNGMYLSFGLIACFSMWQMKDAKNKRWAAAAFSIFLAILLTTKRAHLVFGIASCMAVFLCANKDKTISTVAKVVVGLLIVVLVVYLLSLFIPALTEVINRFSSAWEDDTFGGRGTYYDICLRLWRQNPLFGNGWNSFTNALYLWDDAGDLRRLYAEGNLLQNAHNVYFQLLAEEGIVGIILFCVAVSDSLVSTIKLLANDYRTDEGRFIKYTLCFSVGVQVFFLLYGVTGNPLYTNIEYVTYLFATGPMLAHWTERPSFHFEET